MRMINTMRTAALFWLLLSPIAATPAPAIAQEGQPRLVVNNPTVNFGTVEQGSPAQGIFELKNEGSASLKILGVQPACGCTAAMMDSNDIAPGQTAQLKATLSTTEFSGHQAKKIRLTTNDPEKRSVELTIEGEILPLITVEPPRLYLRKLDSGKEWSQSFTVKLKPELNAQITEVKAGSDKVQLALSEIENGKKVTVTLAPNLPLGVFSDQIVVATSSTKAPMVRIPIFAYVVGDWRVIPENVSFGTVMGPLKEPLKKQVKISTLSGKGYKVLSATANNPAIQTALRTGKDGAEFEVEITIDPKTVGAVRGELNLETDHPLAEQKRITIPVFVNVAVKAE